MARVLVIGATGFIGPRVVAALKTTGHEAWSGSRTGSGSDHVKLDRSLPQTVRDQVRRLGVERIVDLVAYTANGTAPLLGALDGHVERYLLASSGDVYRNYEGLHRKARPPIIDGPLTETSPLRLTRYPYRLEPPRAHDDPMRWMDDYEKIDVEAALMSRPGLDGVVLRLPMVYGPGDRQRRFRWIVRGLQSSPAKIQASPQWLGWRTSYGFVDDVGSAIALAATAIHKGGVFNVGEADPPSHKGWIEQFAQVLDAPVEVESGAPAANSPLNRLDFTYPLVLDTAAIRARFGWREPTAPADAIDRTIADELARS